MATALRPRSGTEIIDAAFAILRAHFVPLVTLSVATHLPVLVLRILLALSSGGSPAAPASFFDTAGNLLASLLETAAALPVIAAASQFYLGDPYDPGAAIRRGLQRVWRALAASIMRGILILISALAFVIPGLYVALRYAPTMAVAVLEDGDSSIVISRTWALTKDEAANVLVVCLPMVLIYAAIVAIETWVLSVIGTNLAMLRYAGLYAVFATALNALGYPIVNIVTVALYYDLRIRKEGFDVEMMVRAPAESAAPVAG